MLPKSRYLELEKTLRNLKYRDFPDIQRFYKEFKVLFKRTNKCLNENEKLNKRDKIEYFLASLPISLKQLYVDHDYMSVKDFVTFVERRNLKQQKYNIEIPERTPESSFFK